MRDIEFRGIDNDNGEFVFGYYTKLLEGARRFDAIVVDDEEDGLVRYYIHSPKTIGQYTGIKDKNDAKVFEGDLIQWNFASVERVYQVYFDDSSASFLCKLVKYSDKWEHSNDEFEESFHKRMISEGSRCRIQSDRWAKVIGNIHQSN